MVNRLLAYNCSFCFPCSCLPIVGQFDQLPSNLVFTSSYITLQKKCYSFPHWHTHLDPITIDTIRSKGLLVSHFMIPFFAFYWYYFNIPLLFALHLLCYFLNPICTFIVFYIVLPYSRPEFSRFFFLICCYILFIWLSTQFLIELLLDRLKQTVLPILLYAVYIFI